MRCSTVSVDKVDCLCERSMLAEINRAGISGERDTVEEIGQQATIVCIPSTGRPVRVLHRGIGLPGSQIQLVVQ